MSRISGIASSLYVPLCLKIINDGQTYYDFDAIQPRGRVGHVWCLELYPYLAILLARITASNSALVAFRISKCTNIFLWLCNASGNSVVIYGTVRETNWKNTFNRFMAILSPVLPSTELWPLENESDLRVRQYLVQMASSSYINSSLCLFV